MRAVTDLVGQTFGRLTVLERAVRPEHFTIGVFWLCICTCRNQSIVNAKNLKSGNTASCGCYSKELSSAKFKLHTKHGMWKTLTYYAWEGAKQRTTNPNNRSWKYYGARGIIMSPEWANSFEQFLIDMGEKPKD